MNKRSNAYWTKRAAERMAEYEKDSAQTINIINRAYNKAIADLEIEIETIFKTFGRNGQLDPDKARKILNQRIPNPLLDFARLIYPRLKNDRVRQWLLNKMNAPAYRARITRLQVLKEQVYIQSKIIADAEIQASTTGYIDTINNAYYRNLYDIQKGIGVGFDVAAMPTKTIEGILRNPWSGKHFSSRVWKNTDVLADKITETITAGFMSGKGNRKIAQELEELSNMGKMAAARLVRTETNYMANAAEMESYKEAEIDRYIFVATLDLRTSDICREHDRKVYKVSEAVTGENKPPLHPWCRSTTRAYLGPDTLKGVQRKARDPQTGKNYLVLADMNYGQWYEKHVISKYGKDQAAVMKKKIVNKAADQAQFERYKNVLGKDIPKSFTAFQELKYNKPEEFRFIKLDHTRRNRLINRPELALPNVEKTTAAEEKFTGYLFNPRNKDGYAKGTAFAGRLGYNADNWQELQQEIVRRAPLYPSLHRGQNAYGERYEQKMIIYGRKGKPANVVVGWLKEGNTTKMTSAYIKEVKASAKD